MAVETVIVSLSVDARTCGGRAYESGSNNRCSPSGEIYWCNKVEGQSLGVAEVVGRVEEWQQAEHIEAHTQVEVVGNTDGSHIEALHSPGQENTVGRVAATT